MIILCIALIASLVVTAWGVYLFWDYSNGLRQASTLPPIAGIELAWGQSGGNISPGINIDLTPEINDSGVSGITISVLAWFSSNNPFGFAVMSPYTITRQFCQGDWTSKNFGNSSLIYLTYNPSVNKTHSNDELNTACAFQFTGLQYRYDRGTCSITLPFAAGGPAWVWNYVIQKSPQLTTDTSLVLHLNVYVPVEYTTITSNPPYSYVKPYLSPGPIQNWTVVHIDMNQVNDLTMSYEDPNVVSTYATYETLSVLFLGIGIPLSLGMSGQVYRTWKREKDKTSEIKIS